MKGRIIVSLTALLVASAFVPTAQAAVTANAGPDKTLETGSATTFDGSASSASGESIASYNWDFGDGTTGSGATVSKTYTTAGTYTATLLVVGTQGATSTDTATVTVRTTDTSAPNITHTMPTSASANSAISVSATVTDNIGILSADVFYKRSDEGQFNSSSLTCTGSATSQTCNGTIPSSVTTGTGVHYYIRARDTRSPTANTNYYPANAPTGYLTLSLSDATPPTITHTVPSGATQGVDLNITATLADNVAVDVAKVFYSFNGTNTFTSNVTMSRASGSATSGSYYAVITGSTLPGGGTIQYYIEVNDTSNRVTREPSAAPGCFSASTCTTTSLGVTSANAPTITHTAVTTATAGSDLTLTATVAPGTGRTLSTVAIQYRTGTSGAFTAATMTPNVGGGGQAVYTGTIPGAAINDLGVQYFINATDSASDVTSKPSAGSSGPTSVLTPPGAPSALAATRASGGAVLTWTAPSTSATNTVASYRVYRSTDGSTFSLIGSPTSATYTDTAEGVRYYYNVTAVDAFGTAGSASATVQLATRGALPSAPTLTLTASETAITATWTATAPVGGYYLVERSTGGSYTEVANVSATTASLAGLTTGTQYTVRVTPYNAYHEAGTAATGTATPAAASSGGGSGGGSSGGSGSTVPLTVAITTPTTGAIVTGPVSIAGTAAGTGLTSVTLAVSGAGGFPAVTGTTSWSATWTPASSLADGNYTITATATAGTQSATATVVVKLQRAATNATTNATGNATGNATTGATNATGNVTSGATNATDDATGGSNATRDPTSNVTSPTPTPTPTAPTPSPTPARTTPTATAAPDTSATPTPTAPTRVPGFEAAMLLLAGALAIALLARRR